MGNCLIPSIDLNPDLTKADEVVAEAQSSN